MILVVQEYLYSEYALEVFPEMQVLVPILPAAAKPPVNKMDPTRNDANAKEFLNT